MVSSIRVAAWLPVVLLLLPLTARAQVPEMPAADSLRRAVSGLTARLDSLEAGRCPAGPAIAVPDVHPGQDSSLRALSAAVRRLAERLERAVATRCPPGAMPAAVEPSDS
ncbi:MAG: hypothetical protein ACREOF_17035, partial [Gemmatimonadales bacterium]